MLVRNILLLLCASLSLLAQPYKNPKLPVETRVADLLKRMTLEEKVAQTQAIWQQKARIMDAQGNFDPAKAPAVLSNGLGQVTRPSEKKNPRQMAEFTNAIQKWVMTNTRLGVPIMFHEECLHGHAAPKGTHFPQAIALAGTFNPELAERIYAAIAREVRARGAQQTLAPVLDIARDPRWGRTEETLGEDPYLTSMMGTAIIRGFQGQGPALAKDHIFATMKHYAAHGQPENGTNSAPANFSMRELREVFLPAFEAVVRKAGVMSVMPSYNEIDGVPSSGNRWLLDDVLRKEWGFNGFVVSDYNSILELYTLHKVASSKEEAARIALESGVDLELPDIDCYATLAGQVKKGLIPMAALDRAVGRILRAKFLAGLFDDPYADPDLAEKVTNSEEHRKLAREAARQSVVLLKNEGGLLPLTPAKAGTLAVIGPNADKVLLGGYSDDPGYFVTVRAGLAERLGASRVVYSEGCRITEPGGSWYTDKVVLSNPAEDTTRIEEARRVASSADKILLVVGGNEEVSREAWAVNHLGDMDNLDLPGKQLELFDAMIATGKPVIVLILGGRPYAIPKITEKAPAILWGWYLGQESGHGFADVVFGDYNPAARLPVSLARSVGQLPIYYSHKPSARRGYLFGETRPLYPFGYGLSYTTFAYSNLRVEPAAIPATGTAIVKVDVVNTGSRDGDEVVQLYVRDDYSSVTRPLKQLKGFSRVQLKAGEKRTVELKLGPEQLAFYGLDMKKKVEAGTFTLLVGGSSDKTIATKLEVE